ncbi:MAG: ATP-binding cassette domain-containing protein [Alcanivorax sp.]|nr:ATP-binding cassette domain-containing protein [Alcanivorax sp.]
MPLIRLSGVSLAFGSHALLDKVDFHIQPGERIGLIGRNGEGKSTLIRLIAGSITADDGEVWRDSGLRVSLLEQSPVYPPALTVYEIVVQGLGEVGAWISEYHALSMNPQPDEGLLKKMGRLQEKLEAHDGWNLHQRVERVITELDLPGDKTLSELSGGWLRRVSLAKAWVVQPDLLLLDEPTNHLDLETILWLEERLLDFPGALLIVTHDRRFLQRLATRVIDLDRGQLVSWPADYSDYLKRKATALQEELQRNVEFDKKLAKEEAWIRQGIQARRTRNEGRVRALKKMRRERMSRRERVGTARIGLATGEQSGKRVIEAEHIGFGYDSTRIVSDFSFTLLRGDRVGLIGANGAGKSTLLKLLLGRMKPDSGTVNLGTRIEIAFFDQMREALDPKQTLVDWVGDGSDFIVIDGHRKHVLSYLGDFLFSPDRARSRISSLSGGERNRLLLARLFRKPANILVMDEPTNDLDIETLELLEELLINYPGSLLLVSHDREFIDNVVTSTLVFEEDGKIREYVGGYSDWLDQRTEKTVEDQSSNPKPVPRPKKAASTKKKLGYMEQRELDALPAVIETLEAKQAELHARIGDSDFYQADKNEITRTLNQLDETSGEIEANYAKWVELEVLQSRANGRV